MSYVSREIRTSQCYCTVFTTFCCHCHSPAAFLYTVLQPALPAGNNGNPRRMNTGSRVNAVLSISTKERVGDIQRAPNPNIILNRSQPCPLSVL